MCAASVTTIYGEPANVSLSTNRSADAAGKQGFSAPADSGLGSGFRV